MKKLTCIVLLIMIIVSCVSVTATATNSSNCLHFDVNSAGWTGFKRVYCHIWEYGGEPFYNYGAKKEMCADLDGDGVWTYDLSERGITLKDGVLYAVVFGSDRVDTSSPIYDYDQTYTLLFDSTVLGDTAYCDGTVYEDFEDLEVTFWRNQDETVFGPEKTVATNGEVIGTCVPKGVTSEKLLEIFLVNCLDFAMDETGKSAQKLIDDTAFDLNLSKNDVVMCLERTDNAGSEFYLGWNSHDSTLEFSLASYDEIEVKRAVRQYRELTGDRRFKTNRFYFYMPSTAESKPANSEYARKNSHEDFRWDGSVNIYWTGTNRFDPYMYPGFVPMITDDYYMHYADIPDFVTSIEWNNGVDYTDESKAYDAVSTGELTCAGHENMVYYVDVFKPVVEVEGKPAQVSGRWYYYYGNGCFGEKENGNAFNCIRSEYRHFNDGDADGDGDVSIMDATEIQLVLAGIKNWKSSYEKDFANVDCDDEVSIMDATAIQVHLAGLD